MTTLPHRFLARLALPVLAAAVLAAPLAGQRTERFSLEGRSATIHNLAGEVRVVPGTGNAVVVEVTRGGEDAGRLRVVRDGGELRVVYPGERVLYERWGARKNVNVQVRRDGGIGGSLFGSRQVTVAGTGAGTRAWADVRVMVPAGRRVSVYQAVGGVQVANVNAELSVRTRSAPVRTQGTRGELNVEASSGGVEVRDAQGEVTVTASSGAVVLSNLRGTLLDVGAGRGSVTGSGLRMQTVDVGMGNGDVSLTGVQAREVTVQSGRGDVTVGMLNDADVEIDTGSGGVTVSVPPSFGAQVEIGTGNGGGITVDLPATNRRTNRFSFVGDVGDGRGSLLIETGAGTVRVRRN